MDRLILMLAFISLIICIPAANASHIVGGEIQILHKKNNSYILTVFQYIDAYGENTQSILETENTITVAIFQKRGNILLLNPILTRTLIETVPYSNPNCDDSTIKTYKIAHEIELVLDPSIYNDPEGYYISWERCCRNNTIQNIENPESTGQTFYMEFPAVVQNGQSFINSSPSLFPPISDYACKNQMFYFDFSGSDPDGDSLVYSLATPLGTHTSEATPPQNRPAPFPPVNFIAGISGSNMIPGAPNLAISRDGFLTVKPSLRGLFVFAVNIEEFRNGVKIGEIRRDYQILVADFCSPGAAPQITMRKGAGPVQSGNVVVEFDKNNDERCLDIRVTDLDMPENVRLLMRPVNFSSIPEGLVPDTVATLTADNSVLEISLCFPVCPDFTDAPYIIDLLALDDACSFPLLDTLHLEVYYKDFAQQNPFFDEPGQQYTLEATPGQTVTLPIQGIDFDGDELEVAWIADTLRPADFDAALNFTSRSSGEWNGSFRWTFNCEKPIYESLERYTFRYVLRDKNDCLTSLTDTLSITLQTLIEPNVAPQFVNLPFADGQRITVRQGQEVVWNIRANDVNTEDPLTLSASSESVVFQAINLNFPTRNGVGQVNGPLNWTVPCSDTHPDLSSLDLIFIVSDANPCIPSVGDTVRVFLDIIPQENEAPEIFSEQVSEGDTLWLEAGEFLLVDLLAQDASEDSVFLLFSPFDTNPAFEWQVNDGKGEALGNLRWNTDCRLLGPGFTPNVFEFRMRSEDRNACKINAATETVFYIGIENEDLIPDYLPPNAFTPNGDEFNPTFTLPSLPIDNCANEFVDVEIVNRWGQQVFYSQNRDFVWNGTGLASGVYYYTIRYTNFTFRSPLSVLY